MSRRLRAPAPPLAVGSWASSAAVRNVMRGNRKRDTRPERRLRAELHRRGLRYRVAAKPLKGRGAVADVVFVGARVAVFLDGCFWHGCPDHFAPPRTNAGYWGPKIERNRERDIATNAALSSSGWLALRVWEHEEPVHAAERVATAVQARLISSSASRGGQQR